MGKEKEESGEEIRRENLNPKKVQGMSVSRAGGGCLLLTADGCYTPPSFFLSLTLNSTSSLTQRTDQQASVTDRPSVRVSEGPGGGEEEPSGAAVLAVPAQQGGG